MHYYFGAVNNPPEAVFLERHACRGKRKRKVGQAADAGSGRDTTPHITEVNLKYAEYSR